MPRMNKGDVIAHLQVRFREKDRDLLNWFLARAQRNDRDQQAEVMSIFRELRNRGGAAETIAILAAVKAADEKQKEPSDENHTV